MPELTHFYAETSTPRFATGTAWISDNNADILGGDLLANTKYLIVARAVVIGSQASSVVGCRVQTDDDSTIQDKSTMLYETEQTGGTQGISYLFVHSYTTDASPATVRLQVNENGSGTGTIDQISLFLLDLDAIGSEGTDYYEDIQPVDSGTEYALVQRTTALATLLGSDIGDDEQLILGYARCDIGSTGRWFDIRLEHMTASEHLLTRHRAEGEDTSGQRIVGVAVVHLPGSYNIEFFGTEESNNANMTDGGAYLIALPTSLFADAEVAQDGSLTHVEGTETTIETLGPYTPSVNGNHLIFGHTTNGGLVKDQLGGVWVEEGTTEIRTGDAYPLTHNQLWDQNKDAELMSTFQRYSISSQVTFNFRAQGAAANFDVENAWLVVVNLNPPATGPVERHQQPRVVQGLVSADRRSS